MLIPFLKIPAHYSASDRAGLKRLEKNLKIKKRKQWGLAKRKRLKPPKERKLQKRGFKKRNPFKKKDFKKEKSFKRKALKKQRI
ncbi:hypothetical protein HpBGD65_10820 [Helicobacter pylori]